MENVGMVYDHLEYIIALILWQFGNLVVIWYIFSPFGTLCQENLATLLSLKQYFFRFF
jgi:hypothetical protein